MLRKAILFSSAGDAPAGYRLGRLGGGSSETTGSLVRYRTADHPHGQCSCRGGMKPRRKSREDTRRTRGRVVVRGTQYESYKAAALALGVSRQRVQQIVKHDEARRAGLVPKPTGRPGKPVTFGGATYPSITEAARALGVTPQTIVNWHSGYASRRHIRTIIFDLECLERRVPGPFRDAIAAARRILLQQADLLDLIG